MSESSEFMSPADLAQYLQISLSVIYRWNTHGDGPARIKVGRHIRYRRSDVEAWLSGRVVQAR